MVKNTQNSTKKVKKSYLFGKKAIICVFFAFILFGCAKKDPVESVVDHHHEHIKETLDYAYNNFEQTKDVVFLENELKACDLAIADTLQVYYGQISTCKAEKNYWRLATLSLLGALIGLIVAKIRKVF